MWDSFRRLATALLIVVAAPCMCLAAALDDYKDAVAGYEALARDASLRKDRVAWERVIKKFEDVAEKYPESDYAPEALFVKGKIYERLYKELMKKDDLDDAIGSYDELIREYPGSRRADDALNLEARIYSDNLKDSRKAAALHQALISLYPEGDMVQNSREELHRLDLQGRPGKTKAGSHDKRAGKKPAETAALNTMGAVNHWSNNVYTRIIIEMAGSAPFRTWLAQGDDGRDGSAIEIDIMESAAAPGLKERIESDRGMLALVRVLPGGKDAVRLRLSFRESVSYKAFAIENPARIIVDVNSSAILPGSNNVDLDVRKGVIAEGPAKKTGAHEKSKVAKDLPSIAKQLSLKVSRIVIDPGHGGHDSGARGPNGEQEKGIALEMGKMLARKLEEQGYEVMMTRQDDTFIPLPDRTAFANQNRADLFISIHANADNKRSMEGLRTYFLNLTTDTESIAAASRENETNEKSIADMQYIINDIMLTSRITESSALAEDVQRAVLGSLRQAGYGAKDLGVKHAPFYVLIGSRAPSILIETGFITHASECRLLTDKEYQESMVDGIVDGINRYVIDLGATR